MSGYVPVVGEGPVPDPTADTNLPGTIFQEVANGVVEILGVIVVVNLYVTVNVRLREK